MGGQRATEDRVDIGEKNIPLLLTVLREMLDTEEQKLYKHGPRQSCQEKKEKSIFARSFKVRHDLQLETAFHHTIVPSFYTHCLFFSVSLQDL
jgi:hypothetical protein